MSPASRRQLNCFPWWNKSPQWWNYFYFETNSTEIRCDICKPFESRVLSVKCRHVIASAGESGEQRWSSHSAVDDVITADEQTTFVRLVAFSCLGHSLQPPHRLSAMDEIEQENPSSVDKNHKRKRILDDKGNLCFLGIFKRCICIIPRSHLGSQTRSMFVLFCRSPTPLVLCQKSNEPSVKLKKFSRFYFRPYFLDS